MRLRLICILLLTATLLTGCGDTGGGEAETQPPVTTQEQQTEADPTPEVIGDAGQDEPEADAPSDLERAYIESCMAYLEDYEPELHGRIDYDGAEFRPITEQEVLVANHVTVDPSKLDGTCVVVVLVTENQDYTFQAIVATDGEFLGYLSDV